METRGKYVDKEGLRRQLQRLKKSWPELSLRIRRQIIPFGEVRRRLELVGAPYEPEQIGVSRARFRASFEKYLTCAVVSRSSTSLSVAVGWNNGSINFSGKAEFGK